MGNPTSGLTVQTTMSVSKGRHRQSRSVASLQLEKLSQQESRCNSNEKISTGTFSPRATEENSIASFLGDKKIKRRTRSSLGGSEEFVKGLELHGVALLTEEKKPMSFNPFKGDFLLSQLVRNVLKAIFLGKTLLLIFIRHLQISL